MYQHVGDLPDPLVLASGESVRLCFETLGPNDENVLADALRSGEFGSVNADYRDIFGNQFRSAVRLMPVIFNIPGLPHPQTAGLHLSSLHYEHFGRDETENGSST